MSKILAFDVGGRRTGIAITDDLQMIATPLETVETREIWKYLARLLEKERVETVVVGLPLGLRGEATDGTAIAQEFCEKFSKKYPLIKIERVNEQFTSKLASQALIAGGAKKKQRQKKGELDKVSATIMLQEYLDWR